MAQTTATSVAANVRDAMDQNDLNRAALAEALGKSISWVDRRLQGNVEFRPSELVAVADVLNTSARALLVADESMAATAEAVA